MPSKEDESRESKAEATVAETDEELSDAGTDEDEVEGHVSTPDLWLPSNNKWKRRRP